MMPVTPGPAVRIVTLPDDRIEVQIPITAEETGQVLKAAVIITASRDGDICMRLGRWETQKPCKI